MSGYSHLMYIPLLISAASGSELSGRKPQTVPVGCKSRASSVPDREVSEIPFNLRKLRSQSPPAGTCEDRFPGSNVHSRRRMPRLHPRDRIFWARPSGLWRSWRSSRLMLQTETVIRALVHRIPGDDSAWRPRRIRSELHPLGYEVAELMAPRYGVRGGEPLAGMARLREERCR